MSDEWVETTLGGCYAHITTRATSSDLDSAVPYLGLEHLSPEVPVVVTGGAIGDVSGQVSAFSSGDTLFGRLRPYLRKVSYAGTNGYCSPEILVLRPDVDVIHPRFLHLLASSESVIERAIANSAGSRMPRTSAKDLADTPILLPPLRVQRRIVDLLEHLDTHLANLRAEREALGYLHVGLSDALIGGYPTVSAGSLGEGKRGLVGGPFGSDLTRKDYVEDGVPVIRGTNMPGSGKYLQGEFIRVSEDKANSLKANIAVPGDVIFTQRGTLGQVGIVPQSHDRFVVSQSQMRLRVERTRALADYIFFHFSRPSIVASLKQQNTATANPHINLGILAKQEVPLPSIEKQVSIVETLNLSQRNIEAVATEIASAEVSRMALLGSLLSRELEIPDSYDELLNMEVAS